ncbi:MAG: alanine racemase [Gammaproteobacteria bacterium]|nr:alanine racemase [Gammaproteobacteria bacterium]
MTRPARATFDAQAVRSNLRLVKQHTAGRRVMAIVKADGYGHGVLRMAHALNDVDAFGVASIEEAVRLRDAGITQSIVLLEGPFEARELTDIVGHRLESVVHNREQARLFAANDTTPLWIKIDTGMHRLGFAPEQVPEIVATLTRPGRALRFMTHFASAHFIGDVSVTNQLALFTSTLADLPGERCSANSSAILGWPQSHGDWVRPGLMLYGVSPFANSVGPSLGLRPAMTLTSALIAVKRVAAGESVGYGKGFVCPQAMPVGIVAFGYADGYPRHAATGAPILVNSVRTQVIGEASMDMMAVDLRAVPEARVGDPVILWGEGLPVEEVARAAATIPYDLLCRMRMRARIVERHA